MKRPAVWSGLGVFLLMSMNVATFAADSAATPTPLDDKALQQLLAEGRDALQAGRHQDAIKDKYDPIIQSFEQQLANSDKLVFCARSPMEAILYSGIAGVAKKDADVLDTLWSDAYLLKGYSLIELGRLDEAEKIYKEALKVNRSDQKARDELTYTKELRKKAGAR